MKLTERLRYKLETGLHCKKFNSDQDLGGFKLKIIQLYGVVLSEKLGYILYHKRLSNPLNAQHTPNFLLILRLTQNVIIGCRLYKRELEQ